jgi:[CysO sulfur-carrier protein]-S-L-cysteine hydrolase
LQPGVLGDNDIMTAPLTSVIEIPAGIHDQMTAHARAELPNEACGLLAGPESRIERFFPIGNRDGSPTTFTLDATEQLRAENEIEDSGWRVLGVFHSHPSTEAFPSRTDRARAFWPDSDGSLPVYPDVHYVIASLADPDDPVVRAFRIVDPTTVDECEVRIT